MKGGERAEFGILPGAIHELVVTSGQIHRRPSAASAPTEICLLDHSALGCLVQNLTSGQRAVKLVEGDLCADTSVVDWQNPFLGFPTAPGDQVGFRSTNRHRPARGGSGLPER